MTKIVRKELSGGHRCTYWLAPNGAVMAWCEVPGGLLADHARESGWGWPAKESNAERNGTTLAALRDELTEEE